MARRSRSTSGWVSAGSPTSALPTLLLSACCWASASCRANPRRPCIVVGKATAALGLCLQQMCLLSETALTLPGWGAGSGCIDGLAHLDNTVIENPACVSTRADMSPRVPVLQPLGSRGSSKKLAADLFPSASTGEACIAPSK